jgi:ribosomal protein S18 acetylase RimI-like enzyme
VSEAAPAVALRPATEADRDFLARVYASTREQELAQVPLSPEQKAAFLRQQFEAQSAHYESNYTETSFDVVLVDGEPAGRLIVARWAKELRVVDIAMLPEQRGRGVGGRLMGELLAEADERGVKASIHVERANPAMRFYERLGFVPAGEHGVYLLMERQAKTAS